MAAVINGHHQFTNGGELCKAKQSVDIASLEKIAEGKTKIIRALSDDRVIVESKDDITAFNAERKHTLKGKGAVANMTTCSIFQFLSTAGIPTHFIGRYSETSFEAQRCSMIPLEFITRRIATGSFLKRNEGVPEGFRFAPPKLEVSFKDDAAGDPFWTDEMIVARKFECGGRLITDADLSRMKHITLTVFEILERAWSSANCSLIDMKIEFGVTPKGSIVLADVIDSDSWRLWPSGDKRLQLDKQFYRDLKEVTTDDLKQLKSNFEKAAEIINSTFLSEKPVRVVVMMGSTSDKGHCEKIADACASYSIATILRVCSAHKETEEALKVLAQYEADGIPTVFVCVAGRSNGLGPVTAGNSSSPVLNCPPAAGDDIWSSLRLPSHMHGATILTPENAAMSAASILGMQSHVVFARLRAKRLTLLLALMEADEEMQKK